MTSQQPTDNDISPLAFFLADFAAVESGKTYVSGGFWDRIAVPEFPASAFFSVVAVLKVPWDAYHVVHSFSIVVEDEFGTELMPGFDGQFQVNSAPHLRAGDPTIMPITGTIPGMTFDAPGEYAFILHINGREADRWPLRVFALDDTQDGPPEPVAVAEESALPQVPPTDQL